MTALHETAATAIPGGSPIGSFDGNPSAGLSGLALSDPTRNLSRLSHRQRQVMVLLGQGLTQRETGLRLGLAERTVRYYAESAYREIDLGGYAASTLVEAFIGLGWLKVPS